MVAFSMYLCGINHSGITFIAWKNILSEWFGVKKTQYSLFFSNIEELGKQSKF